MLKATIAIKDFEHSIRLILEQCVIDLQNAQIVMFERLAEIDKEYQEKLIIIENQKAARLGGIDDIELLNEAYGNITKKV